METKIFDYGMNAEGIASVDGKIALVDGALMDEVVDIETIEDFGNYLIAKVNKLITKSNSRTNPACPYFNQCGGCQLQHMKYDEQLKFKTNHIKKTIKKITGLEVNVNNTVSCSSLFNYRNKMSFSVNNLNCGLLRHNSKEIININNCPLADENINKVLYIFKEYININKCNHIKNLVVRSIQNQVLVGVVVSKHIDLKNLLSTFNQHFEHIGLYEIINTRNDSVVLSGKLSHIGGIKEIIINDFNLSYSVDLLGFHQTNTEIQNKLYNHVLKYISPNSVVINGFSGQGLLTAILAKKAKHVTGIEINKSSHVSAENLKQANKIKNIINICGDFHKQIKQHMKNANAIILDPTKKGCGKTVMNEINGIENIIYVSCNPIALSKDLNVIKNDYEIEEITPYDMFPNTINVETLVKLKKIKKK